MTDQELLQAIGQVIESKIAPVRQDIYSLKKDVLALQEGYSQIRSKVDGIRISMDTDLDRTLNLLLEGQQTLWDRIAASEQYESLESRTEILELTVKRHSQELLNLRRA